VNLARNPAGEIQAALRKAYPKYPIFVYLGDNLLIQYAHPAFPNDWHYLEGCEGSIQGTINAVGHSLKTYLLPVVDGTKDFDPEDYTL
jgi:hypothetical protein